MQSASSEQTASYPAIYLPSNPGCSLSIPVSTTAMFTPLPVNPKSHAPTGYIDELLALIAGV